MKKITLYDNLPAGRDCGVHGAQTLLKTSFDDDIAFQFKAVI